MTPPSPALVARRQTIVTSVPQELREWVRETAPDVYTTLNSLENATKVLADMGIEFGFERMVERLAFLWRDQWQLWKKRTKGDQHHDRP